MYHGREFIGWLGAFRCGPKGLFKQTEVRAAQAFVDPLVAAMSAARKLERDGSTKGSAHMILSPAGRIEHSCPSAANWLTEERRTLIAKAVKNYDRSNQAPKPISAGNAEIRIVRMDGVGQVRYLVLAAPICPITMPADCSLTERQRAVAHFAAASCTALEIGEELGISINTVKTLLKQVYERLEVSNRVELMQVLREG